jgi:hypothetical protein
MQVEAAVADGREIPLEMEGLVAGAMALPALLPMHRMAPATGAAEVEVEAK